MKPPVIGDDIRHFKYGSIGAEVNGYPYLVWRELPRLYAQELPAGWETFGLLTEPGETLPIGISVRRYGVQRVGFNCATCHSARIEGAPGILLGAPSASLDLQRYLLFLVDVAARPDFTADAVFDAAEAQGRPFGWLNRGVYRYYVIPQIRKQLANYRDADGAWMKVRAPHGPGRTDAGNPWRVRFGMHPERDELSGAVDMPSLWNQRIRSEVWMHWDGNNRSLRERNLSAALAGGASEDSLDHPSIERVAAWALDLKPPPYPFAIDAALAGQGKAVYEREGCGGCHDPGGARYGESTPDAELGADPDRLNLFSAELVQAFGTVGSGKPWQFRNYRKSDGYANAALDGIWARAPYMHNGSVPSLHDLLLPATARPATFVRGCATFDPNKVGFICGAGANVDTKLRGNGNGGHEYGTALTANERTALAEYLKTL